LYNFRLWPLVCRLESANYKKILLSTFSFQDIILNVSVRSPLILHLFSVVSPKMWSLSKYFLLFIPSTHFVALFWTLSSTSSFLRKCGFQLCAQYSKWGLMNDLEITRKLSLSSPWQALFTIHKIDNALLAALLHCILDLKSEVV